MQCYPNKRIYIKALSQHSHKKRKDFLLVLLTMVSRIISEIERKTHKIQFPFFNWSGSFRNKPLFLDFNLKVFVPRLSFSETNIES